MKFVFFVLMCSLFFTGCTSSLEKQIWDNIAEVREFVVFGKSEGLSVSLTCGKREKIYKIDGYATDLIPFGIITIQLESIDTIDVSNANFVLYVGTEKFIGDLEKNPFDNTLVADIGKIVDKNQNISIDIFVANNKTSLKLKKIDDDWIVSSKDCIGILIKNYKDQLQSFVGNEFEGEVYIKILDDYDVYNNDFYYYVSVFGRAGSSINMIISPKTGEVLASNSNLVPKSS